MENHHLLQWRRAKNCISGNAGFRQIVAVDYDNDGWLDLWAVGEKSECGAISVFPFQEQTAQLSLDKLMVAVSNITILTWTAIRCDCRPGKRGPALPARRVATPIRKSKCNCLGTVPTPAPGCKVEIETGGLRLIRTVQRLPVSGGGEISHSGFVPVHYSTIWARSRCLSCKDRLRLGMDHSRRLLSIFVWVDGKHFRFVTDILGAAPLGLPMAEAAISRPIRRICLIGNERTFPGGRKLPATDH
jgi:hypothetical protein